MKHKIKKWTKRYLPAEIAGTLSALILPSIVFLFSRNTILSAFLATWGENIGFYAVMIISQIRSTKRKKGRYRFKEFRKDIRNMLLEFGPAEIFDSFIIRPGAMYFSIALFGNLQIGIVAGKIIADIIFYLITIASYQARKKYLKD